MDLKITGLEQVIERLQGLPKEIVVKSYAKALDRAAGVIAAELEARAEGLGETETDTPLYEHVIVGTEVDTNGRGGIAKVGFDSSQDARTGKPQDAKALWVEMGHRMVPHETHGGFGVAHGHVPAHPFVRPAFEAAGDEAIAVFEQVISQEIGQ